MDRVSNPLHKRPLDCLYLVFFFINITIVVYIVDIEGLISTYKFTCIFLSLSSSRCKAMATNEYDALYCQLIQEIIQFGLRGGGLIQHTGMLLLLIQWCWQDQCGTKSVYGGTLSSLVLSIALPFMLFGR